MENEVLKAYAEVDEILSLIDRQYLEKIPLKIRNIFKNEKLKDYKPKINIQEPLNEQNLQRKTIIFLAILYLNYWCESEEEKQKLLLEFADNEKIKEQELREKYNPDNMFKKTNITKQPEKMEMIEYREKGFLKKILSKIIRILKRENR